MANFSALTTQKASQNAPNNVKGCPKLLSSVDLGHFLTFWLVANWGALGMEKKCVIFYLGRVPSYFFPLKKSVFSYVGRTVQENNPSGASILQMLVTVVTPFLDCSPALF
jgi:hypothetical protein